MNTFRQIFRNTVSGWIAVLLRTAIALVMVPFLLSYLGKEGYGLVGLLMVLVSLTDVADLGLRNALGRELSEQVARNDRRALNELFATSMALYIAIAAILIASLWIAAPWIVRTFRMADVAGINVTTIIRFYGSLSVLMSFVSPVFSASLASHNRFDLVNSILISVGLVSSLAMFVVIPIAGNPLYAWTGVMLVQQFLTLVILGIFHWRTVPGAELGFRLVKPSRVAPLFHLGGTMYALQMAQTLSEKADPLVISHFFGPSGVALYHPGGRLSQVLRPVVQTLSNQLYPVTTRHHIDNRRDKMHEILITGTRYTLLLGTLFSSCTLVFADPFCRLWLYDALGPEYRIAAYVMMGWAVADLFTYAAGTQWAVLLGMKRLRVLVWIQLPTAALNLAISIYLVGFTQAGIPGVMVATVLIGFIRRPVVTWYTARCCGLRIRTYLSLAYVRPAVCLAVTLGTALLARRLNPLSTYTSLAAAVAATGVVWLAACWFGGVTRAERSFFRTKFLKPGTGAA